MLPGALPGHLVAASPGCRPAAITWTCVVAASARTMRAPKWPKPPNTTTRYVIACSPLVSVHSIGERTVICACAVVRSARGGSPLTRVARPLLSASRNTFNTCCVASRDAPACLLANAACCCARACCCCANACNASGVASGCAGVEAVADAVRVHACNRRGLPFAQSLLTCGQPDLSIGQLLAAQMHHRHLMQQGWITHQVLLPIGTKPEHAPSIAAVRWGRTARSQPQWTRDTYRFRAPAAPAWR